jgi:phosphate transport system permease protein
LLNLQKKRKFSNILYVTLASASFFLALVPLISIVYETLVRGYAAISLDFFTKITPPIGEAGGGILNAMEGSLVMVAVASLVGVPLGILGGAYLSEYTGHLASQVRLLTEVLAGVPSIVIGIVVYELVVMPQHRFSALSGGIALAIIMIPVVVISTHESLKLVSSSIKEAGLALGISRSKTLLHITLRSARNGVITGIALAVARIMGETAPLLFTALGSQFLMTSLNDPAASITVLIYDFGTSPYLNSHTFAWGAALVLLLLVLGLNIIVRAVSKLKIAGTE